jgi:hypothetical protein
MAKKSIIENNARPLTPGEMASRMNAMQPRVPDLLLWLKPFKYTNVSSISSLFIHGNDRRICYFIECPYTGANTRDNPQTAVNEAEAILAGRYELTLTMSPGFKRLFPRLLGVPGRDGILWHPGNKASELRGCQAPGLTVGENQVGRSFDAYSMLCTDILLPQWLKGGKVFVEVVRP